MQPVLYLPGGDVRVFEITEIRYNEAFDSALFRHTAEPELDAGAGTDGDGASATAVGQRGRDVFFDGLASQDRDVFLAAWAKNMAGLQVISLGEPFQPGKWSGWFVPYEISMNGHVKKRNLAVRNDNPAHRRVFDGGF